MPDEILTPFGSTPEDDLSVLPTEVNPILQATPLAPKAAPLPTMHRQLPSIRRRFGDPNAIRDLIYKNVLDQASKIEPVKNARFTLSLNDLHYADPPDFPLKKQKEAILGNKTLYRRLKGTWRLSDSNTGQTVDEKKMTIAQVPHMTERGTFILHGTEYTLSHQMRLRPGIFTRIKANQEVEAHVNVMPGKGVSHRYFFEPESSIFRINVGQSKVPLLPILRALGVNNRQLKDAWGPEILALNIPYDSPHIIDKLYERMVRKADPKAPQETKRKALAEELKRMELDPEVTRRTLGAPYKNLTPEAILATTKKLLAVNKREQDPDDRDHLAFQTLMGPEDLIAERIGKDRATLNKLVWTSTFRGNLEHIQPGAFTRSIMASFLTSGLGQAAEEVNAAELVDHQGRITRLGEGGIGDAQAVPEECFDKETEVLTYNGWKNWADITMDDQFACLINNRIEFHKPIRLMQYDHDGPMYGLKTRCLNYLVTPNHEMWCSSWSGEWRTEYAKDIHRQYRIFQIAHEPYIGNPGITTFTPPMVEGARTQYRNIPIDDWAEFLGWVISEGHIDKYALRVGKKYKITISQDNDVNGEKVKRIGGLLAKMGIAHSYSGHNFSFVSKQLGVYFAALGIEAKEKFLPEEIYEWPISARLALMTSMALGDGHKYENGVIVFHSSSKKLMQQFSRLATSLGYPVRECAKPRKFKNPKHNDSYNCRTLISRTQGVMYKAGLNNYYTMTYKDKVYCAEVPGNRLLVRRNTHVPLWMANSRNVHPSQMGFVDPVKTPESFKAGVDLRTAFGVQKGTDNKLYAPFAKVDKGRLTGGPFVYRSPQELADLTVAFPTELDSNKAMIAAMQRGRLRFVPRHEVDLALPSMENTFSPLSNMIPMKSAVKGQRVSMGARMLSQALPLQNAEAPFIQTAAPGIRNIRTGEPLSFEELYGQAMGIIRAPGKDMNDTRKGTVLSVDPDEIKIKYDDGQVVTTQLYNHHPYNRKTYLHNTPLVKPGDKISANDVLAKSNYTTDTGTAALGLNARVAYLPFQGKTYEDATVISNSMAKRMTSEHMYQHVADFSDNVHRGKNAYISLFPGKYSREVLDRMDDKGVVKPGTVVNYDEPLALLATEKERAHNQVHRSAKSSYTDNTITWKHNAPGLVTDVVHTRNGALVAVKAYMPMQVGDKLAGRYGDKSVVADIVPDDQMPHDTQGRPFEILVSPMGLISRINSAQAVEAALGKIAEKTGKPYKVGDFQDQNQNLTQYALNELSKHNLSDTETVTDPTTGRQIPNVLTGNRFFMKLHHTSESKSQGRGAGGGYTAEGTPSKGGELGSKRVSLMDTNALLAHGATDVLRDAHTIRGQRNEDYWLQFMAGLTPPDPKVPFIYDKFLNELKAAGINVIREGNRMQVLPMTGKDIDAMSEGRELRNAETVDWKGGLKPIAGGLFDPGLTGGHAGNRWAKIILHEAMPNPAMEEPIRRILGLTEAQFLDILAGKKELHGRSGPQAISGALASIDIPKEIARSQAEIASGKKSFRDTAIRRLGYLQSADRMGIHPKDWMVNAIPVLPPAFRPVSLMQGKRGQLVSDPNYLYREAFDANQNLKALAGKVDDLSEERLNVYNAFKAVTGLGDPIQPKNQERGVKGILRHIFGTSPKFSTVQFKLLGASVNLVGRGVIVPNPDMDMDSIGLPEHRAWDVYQPFIVRELARSGMPRTRALEAVRDRDTAARNVLLKVMSERPVLVNRYPVLHRYGLMAFWPKLVHGETIQVSPIITKGFAADFDGDTMQYHVPAADDARREAIQKMLPSANLFAGSSFKINYVPNQEFVQGLHAASTMRDEGKPKRTFADRKAAIAAYRRGEINLGTPIEILE